MHAGDTCGSGIVSTEADVLRISVACVMGGVGGVCVCVWLGVARGVSG